MTTFNTGHAAPLLGLRVHAIGEFNEGPATAVLALTPAALAEIARLRRVAQEHRLEWAVADGCATVQWGEAEAAREFYWNVRHYSLHVSAETFHFTGYPKHCDYRVETVGVSHDQLPALIEAATASGLALVDCERDELVRESLIAPSGAVMAKYERSVGDAREHEADVTDGVLALPLGVIRALRDGLPVVGALVGDRLPPDVSASDVLIEQALLDYFKVYMLDDISKEALALARGVRRLRELPAVVAV